MSNTKDQIIYTITDEAPALATQSLLPIMKAFGKTAGISFTTKDISLAGRIIANFPENLSDDQRIEDALSELGDLAKTPQANIVKLPNISASIPQLKDAIAELQGAGFKVPNFPEEPKSDEEKEIRARYAKVLGSAVNPVLREGNSDRRVAGPVKEYAQNNPHRMGAWEAASESHVDSMADGDFYSSEESFVAPNKMNVRIDFIANDGERDTLKGDLALEAGEVIDASRMSVKALREFFAKSIDDAKAKDVLYSLHMKATMMKVSDPIIFGECTKVFFAPVFEKHAELFDKIGVDVRNGLGDVYDKIAGLDAAVKSEVEADIQACYADRPRLAMVDSDKGITNLHVPNNVIIDASMPAAIRTSGQMWGPDGNQADTKFTIPDRCYAGVYQAVIEFCKENGAFDPKTMGNVSNVGLMAKKAQEYGSHDKTFWIEQDGRIEVIGNDGTVIFNYPVEAGDIWRMCQTKDIAIRDWVKLGVSRARATGSTAIFWLDPKRSHDATLIEKVNAYLKDHDTDGLDIRILDPVAATRTSCELIREGNDSISITGNVLRDYLTDLFPILELGTSAKMLSIVPLLAGGGLYETGAGGSAPKHVQQFVEENHLRWDSLGEFLALSVSIEDFADKTNNSKGKILAQALDQANSEFLRQDKSPSRKVNELDNRGSHFYLAMYWANALANQSEDAELKAQFEKVASDLAANEMKIVEEMNSAQGVKIDMGGYYLPDNSKVSAAMRPSATFNAIIDSL